jgi:hypothetical protein
MASERAKRGREGEEGSGKGRYSGQWERRAGRGERGAGRIRARKKPHLVRDAAWVGGLGWCLVSVESAICPNSVLKGWGWGWGVADCAGHYQRRVDSALRGLERGGGNGSEVRTGTVTAGRINVKGAHGGGLVLAYSLVSAPEVLFVLHESVCSLT